MLVLLAAAAASPAADIDRLCKSEPSCVAQQRQSLRYFLNHVVVFDLGEATAEACMRRGTTKAGLIDWTRAEACVRERSKGKKSLIPNPDRR